MRTTRTLARLCLCVFVLGFPAGFADEVDEMFDQLVASAATDEERITNAKLLMEKAQEFPDRRKGIEKRALTLAREAEQPESLAIIEQIYAYWLEQPGTPDEKIYAVLIDDFSDAIRWDMPDGEKLAAARKVLSFYDASAQYLIERERYTEAAQVLDQQRDFVRKYRKAVDPDRSLHRTLAQRIKALEERAEEKARRDALLARAKARPGDTELNAQAGALLFREDAPAGALPFLKRGGEAAAPYLAVAELLAPYDRSGETVTPELIRKLEASLDNPETLLPLAHRLMRERELRERAAEVVAFIREKAPLGERPDKLRDAAVAILRRRVEGPPPDILFEAAGAYANLAKRDKSFGEAGMSEENRFCLWKAVELYKRFLAAAPESEAKAVLNAEIQSRLLAKKLEAAGGYAQARTWTPRAEVNLAELGQFLAGIGTRLHKAQIYQKWPFDAEDARRRQVETAKRLGLPVELVLRLPESEETVTLVLIPAGAFAMGTPEEEVKQLMAAHANDNHFIERAPGEYPRHGVRITRPFYLGRTEVTQAQWEAVTGANPSKFTGEGDLPVEQVSWNDVTGDFLAKVNAAAKLEGEAVFALPTEAQWEYACRAGTETEYHAGDGEEALKACGWYKDNSGGRTHPVGGKAHNAWTLYDMHGNVWEWCRDNYDVEWYRKDPPTDDPVNPGQGNAPRVLRGGGWYTPPSRCRSAFRGHHSPDYRHHVIGWRLSLDLH